MDTALINMLTNIPEDMVPGQRYEWPCLCGKTVHGGKTEYNGHLWAVCK